MADPYQDRYILYMLGMVRETVLDQICRVVAPLVLVQAYLAQIEKIAIDVDALGCEFNDRDSRTAKVFLRKKRRLRWFTVVGYTFWYDAEGNVVFQGAVYSSSAVEFPIEATVRL